MDKIKDIRVNRRGHNTVLQLKVNGRWHSIPTDTRNKAGAFKTPLTVDRKQLAAENSRIARNISTHETKTGMSAKADATELSLTTRISFLQGEDSGSRKWFTLPMGVAGQSKFLIVNFVGVGPTYPKVYFKTVEDDETEYIATNNGQVLHLICDGTYWHVLGIHDTSDTNAPGAWDTN